MTDDRDRKPFSALRAWVPERDDAARERARVRLDAHVAAARPARRSLPARRLALALAAVAVAVGAGVAIASGFWRTHHTGHIPVYTAAGALNPRFHVGRRSAGYCWTASLATGAADAYRCMEGNAIHDPCFASSTRASSVACFRDPWHPVTILRLTRPLPRHARAHGSLPWAIETTDGRRCTFLTGATAPMGGERIDYGCTDGSFLIGAPLRDKPLWTIRSARAYRPDPPGHPAPIASFPLAAIEETVP